MNAGVVMLLCVTGPGQLDLEPQERGAVTARLNVRVLDKPTTPGLAEIAYTLTVTGPPGLEVKPAQLEDATAAWQSQATATDRRKPDQITHTEVLQLRQVKPGQLAPPSLSVRFRAGPETDWQRVDWTDILQLREQLGPPPTPEPPSWPWWAVPALVGSGAIMLVSLVLVLLRKPKPSAPPTPQEWARGELLRLEAQLETKPSEWYHTQLSDIVRRYLEEKHGLQAPRQTTKEFLESLGRSDQLPSGQRDVLKQLLERCDLAKFAPLQASMEDCRQASGLARALVEESPNPLP